MKTLNMIFMVAAISGLFGLEQRGRVLAQSQYEMGLRFGVLHPYADITQYNYWRTFKYKSEHKPGFLLSATIHLSPLSAVRGQLLYGWLQGTKRQKGPNTQEKGYVFREDLVDMGFIQEQAVYFRTDVMEVSVMLLYNFTRAYEGAGADGVYAYIGGGIGYVLANPKIYKTSNDRLLTPENNPNIVTGKMSSPTLPVMFGIKYEVTPSIRLSMELAYRITSSDRLDGLEYRGEFGRGTDHYLFTSIGIEYAIGQ